jgi:primosomal protein N''
MMNQEYLFKKLGSILNELQDQYDFLAQNPQKLNELELELFLANANFLTDHVQIIKKINGNKPVKEIPQFTEVDPEAIPQNFSEVIDPVHSNVVPNINPEPSVETPVYPNFTEAARYNISEVEERDVSENNPNKLDFEPSGFEFILTEEPSSNTFEFEEKDVVEIFDRPLSEEEQKIIAEKQKLQQQSEQGQAEVSMPLTFKSEEKEGIFVESITALEPVFVPQPSKTIEAQPIITTEEQSVQKNEGQEVQTFPVLPVSESGKVNDFSAEDEREEVKDLKVEEFKESNLSKDLNFSNSVQETHKTEPAVKMTLNEMLASNLGITPKSDENTSEKPPLSDLKQAININQKLIFIKDLFNGYNLAYAEAIDLLNKMPDYKSADTFLQKNYAVKNNWAAKESTTAQFYELLRRRFPTK